MFDRRYPHLVRVQDAPLGPADRDGVVRAAREIHRRTMCNAAFNTVSGELFFYRGEDPFNGVMAFHVRHANGSVVVPSQADIDNLVRVIKMAEVPMAVKLKWAGQHQEHAEYLNRKALERELEDRRGEAVSLTKRTKNTLGMGKRFRPVVAVNGLRSAC